MMSDTFHRKLLPILLLSLLAAFPAVAKADSVLYEIKVGILDHDVSGLWTGYKLENGDDINAELIFAPYANVLHGKLRPRLGASVNTSGYTSKIYGGGVLEYAFSNGLFLDLGAGAAIHDGLINEDDYHGDEKELGSRVLFHFSLEAGFTLFKHHRFSGFFDHVSNAGLGDPNEGIDTLGVRYGYRF